MYYYRKYNKCLPQHAFIEGIVSSPTDIIWENNENVGTWGMWITPQMDKEIQLNNH